MRDDEAGATAQSVGRFLKELRIAQNLSQEQLADMSQGMASPLSRSAISAIERGRNLPNLEALLTFSKLLHVDPMEILERVEIGATEPRQGMAGRSLEHLEAEAKKRFWANDFRGALSLYERMLESAESLPPGSSRDAQLARIYLHRASALRRCGALIAARTSAERALAVAAEGSDTAAYAYKVIASVHLQGGNLRLARDAARRAVELADGLGPEVEVHVLITRGLVLWQSRRYDDARRVYLLARDRARMCGDSRHLTHLEGNIGLCLHYLGNSSQARCYLTRAVKLARTHGQPVLEASWLVGLGRVEYDEGNLEPAERYASEALYIGRRMDHALNLFRAEWLLHQVTRRRDPSHPDRQRMRVLKRLLVDLAEYRGEPDIEDFRRELLGEAIVQGRVS